MPEFKRNETDKILRKIQQGEVCPVYLIHGDRYLSSAVANDLITALLPDEQKRSSRLQLIDGDQENAKDTLSRLRTYSLFGGRTVFRVMDTKMFHSKVVAKKIWESALAAYAAKKTTQAARYLLQMLSLIQTADKGAIDDIVALSGKRWQGLFGFAKPANVSWIQELDLPDQEFSAASTKHDVADLYVQAFKDGIPPDNILILIAEAVDKRKRLYKYIKKNGVIVNLAVDPGFSKFARKDQEEVLLTLIRKTLASFGKNLEPAAEKELLQRVGFHPVAAVMETEKLALSVDERPVITRKDLTEIIGRTREEALFELNEAVADLHLEKALILCCRLRDNGTHPLAMIAALRNHIRKLLVVRSYQARQSPRYTPRMTYGSFQKGYLEELKATLADPTPLGGHPYALYMLFKKAENFLVEDLIQGLTELLQAEYSLKGSPAPDFLIMENFLFTFIGPQTKKEAQGGRRQ